MGLPDMEAGLLSTKAGPKEISRPLCYPVERRRGQLHISTAGQRNNGAELACGNARDISIHYQSASGHHAHQAIEGDRGFLASLPRNDRTACSSGETWTSFVPATSQSESRRGSVENVFAGVAE